MKLFGFGKKAQHNVTFSEQKKAASAVWMDRNARSFADEGYTRNAPTSRCVQIIARSLASIGILAKIDGEYVDHPILDLLERPNPMEGKFSFLEAYASHLLITGNSFCEALRSSDGRPIELSVWQPYYVKLIRNKETHLPIAYMYESAEVCKVWEVDALTLQSDLLHWKCFSPFDTGMGMSPMEPAAYTIDQHNASSEWNQALLQNAATPDGMLVTKGKLTDSQYERLKKELEQNYSGPQNARKPMLADDSMEWVQMSMNPKDMDWLNGRNANAIDIAMAYGVPVQMLGIEGSQTFANFEQARLSLWEDTVITHAKNLICELNNWLVPMYNESRKLELCLDIAGIDALQFKQTDKMKTVDAISFMTINEKRATVGFPRVETPEADEILIASSLLPLGFDMGAMTSEDAAVKALQDAGRTKKQALDIVKKHWCSHD